LLRAGKSVKTLEQDINETIATLERWKEILKEDELADNDISTNKPMERTSAKYNL
jgi:DNA-binding protein H-NS